MADAIRVTLNPEKLTVQPDGDPVESSITIQNNGTTVDQYAVELDQLPTTWYTLSNTSVALFPQDKEEAKLVVHPPKGAAAKAGSYPFNVTVLSRADSSQTTRVDGVLQIGTVGAFDMVISPSKQTGRQGKYMLHLNNGGNADLDVNLEATDAAGVGRYTLQPPQLLLAAGQRINVPLLMRPRRSWLVGPKKTVEFQVKATPNRGNQKTVTAQLVHKPMFRSWRPLRNVLLFLLLVAAVISAIVLASRHNLGNDATSWKDNAISYGCDHLNLLCDQRAATATAIPAIIPTTVPTARPTPKPTPKPVRYYPFVGAFLKFHKQAPTLVGNGLEFESTNSRVASQRTTTGTLLFDRKDGHTFLVANNHTIWLFSKGVIQVVRGF